MNKLKTVAVIGGAIGLALCWPLAVGQIGQSFITNEIEKLNTELPNMKIELIDYQRGYLSSTANIHLVFDPESDKKTKEETMIKSTIYHRFFSIETLSTLDNQFSLSAEIKTDTTLNGNTDYQIELEPWNYHQDTITATLGRSTVSGRFEYRSQQLKMDLLIPTFKIKDKRTMEEINASNLSISLDGKNENGLWIGKQSSKLDSFSVNERIHTILLEGLVYQSRMATTPENKRMDSYEQLKFAKLESAYLMPFTNFELDLDMKQLDVVSFENIRKALLNGDSDELKYNMLSLFAQGFDFSLNKLDFKYGNGTLNSSLQFHIPQISDVNEQQMIRKTVGNGEFHLSKPLVEQNRSVKDIVEILLSAELAKKEQDIYTIKAEFKDGVFISESNKKVSPEKLLMSILLGVK